MQQSTASRESLSNSIRTLNMISTNFSRVRSIQCHIILIQLKTQATKLTTKEKQQDRTSWKTLIRVHISSSRCICLLVPEMTPQSLMILRQISLATFLLLQIRCFKYNSIKIICSKSKSNSSSSPTIWSTSSGYSHRILSPFPVRALAI